MIKLLGPGNDLYTETGKITKTGYFVMIVSSVFGLLCFFIGRSVYGDVEPSDLYGSFSSF